jgi:hypothetical protein
VPVNTANPCAARLEASRCLPWRPAATSTRCLYTLRPPVLPGWRHPFACPGGQQPQLRVESEHNQLPHALRKCAHHRCLIMRACLVLQQRHASIASLLLLPVHRACGVARHFTTSLVCLQRQASTQHFVACQARTHCLLRCQASTRRTSAEVALHPSTTRPLARMRR